MPMASDNLEALRVYVSLESPDRAQSLAEYPRRARRVALRARKGRDIRELFEPPYWSV